MQKRVAVMIAALIALSVAAMAVEWEETDWGAEVVLNSSTGLPAVVFHATLEYSEYPVNYHLDGGWEIYEVVNGVRIPIEGAPTTARLSGETLTIASATNQITIEAGKSYGAKLTLQDTVNGLSYERSFTYSPTEILPIGISLRGWDGSLEEIDLSELPDEEIEELAVLHDMLTGYAVSPEAQTVVAFLRGDAAARPNTALLFNGTLDEGEEIDRCTYSACGAGCCSTCVEHEEEEGPPAEEPEEPGPDVRIECIVYEGANFEEDGNEYVQIKNYGDLGQDLLGWTLFRLNDRDHVFTFEESFVLEPEMSIRVYMSALYAGEDGFSFGLEESLWTNVVVYPVTLVLLPVPPGSISSARAGITFRVVLTLYTYTLSSRNDIAFVQSQLTQFGQEFMGSIYAGSGSSIIGGGKTVFVHELAMQILETAALELKNR